VRGEWVKLNQSLQQAKQHQTLVNPAVESQLGQALAAAVLLSATIKFKGALIMQIQGGGDLKALVAQCDHLHRIRGLTRSEPEVHGAQLADMLGPGGRLVITLESDYGDPYQGIVPVEAPDLAGVLQTYFQQSEQLASGFWLFADQAQAAGFFLQQLPGENNEQTTEDWQRLLTLANTLKAEELLNLDCEELLHRLFHEEEVRLYESEAVSFHCNCSRAKISTTLQLLGETELNSILAEHGVIDVGCQFCGADYRFDKIDVAQLLTGGAETNPPEQTSTRH
jgi:molecular chaperone Hsp33